MQRALVALLDAELADVFGAAVVAQHVLVPVLHQLLLGLVDAADVTQQVAADLAQRVLAEQPGAYVDAGEAETLGNEAGDFLVAQLGADRQRVETLAVFHQALEAAAVARRDLDHLGQRVDGGVERAGQARGRDLQGVGRVVRGQHDAVAVDDQTAIGHHRQDGDAVGLGLGRQLVMLDHLQEYQPRRQQAEADQHEHGRGQQATPEMPEFAFDVLQLGHVVLTGADSGLDRARDAGVQAATR